MSEKKKEIKDSWSKEVIFYQVLPSNGFYLGERGFAEKNEGPLAFLLYALSRFFLGVSSSLPLFFQRQNLSRRTGKKLGKRKIKEREKEPVGKVYFFFSKRKKKGILR